MTTAMSQLCPFDEDDDCDYDEAEDDADDDDEFAGDAVADKEGVVSGDVVVVDEDVGDSIKVDEVSVRFVEVVAELSVEKVFS